MTRYDPFAYGQLPLAQKEPPVAAPEDMLFTDATPTKQAPAALSDWDPPADKFQECAAGGSTEDALAFGKDILGEELPEAAAKPAAARAGAVKAKPAATAAQPLATPAPVAAVKQPARSQPAAATGKSAEAPARVVQRRAALPMALPMPMPRHTTAASILVPLGCLAGGGTAASWLYVIQQNPVMACIVAAAGVVGAALAWLMLRR